MTRAARRSAVEAPRRASGATSAALACNLSSSMLQYPVVSQVRIDYPRAKVGTTGLDIGVYNLRTVASFAGVPYPNQLVPGLCRGTNAIEAISIPRTRRNMSTSKLQQYVSRKLSERLGAYTIRENIRPAWLLGPAGERLELDFFIEELMTAIEVQGQQHYIYTQYFHGSPENFSRRLEFDRVKRNLCEQYGIELHEVASSSDADQVIQDIVISSTAPISFEAALRHLNPHTIERIEKITFMLSAYTTSQRKQKMKATRFLAKRHYRRLKEYFRHYVPHIFTILPNDLLCQIVSTSQAYENLFKQRAARVKAKIDPGEALRAGRPKHERRAMRILNIARVDLFTFRVWGGDAEHILTLTSDGIQCDCESRLKTSGECSHVAKYRLVYVEGIDHECAQIGRRELQST